MVQLCKKLDVDPEKLGKKAKTVRHVQLVVETRKYDMDAVAKDFDLTIGEAAALVDHFKPGMSLRTFLFSPRLCPWGSHC